MVKEPCSLGSYGSSDEVEDMAYNVGERERERMMHQDKCHGEDGEHIWGEGDGDAG